MALKIQTSTGYLDTYGDESISLDYNVADLRDPAVIFSPITQNFNLPATDANNAFFKHYYDVNIQGGYNAYSKQQITLFSDGVALLDGYIQLLNVTIQDGFIKGYEVLVAGEVGGIARTLGESELSDLPVDALDHTFNWDNIYDSWTTPIGGAITYGMVDGRGFATDSVFAPQSPLHPLAETNFYPHIKVKYLIEQIFLGAGYTINATGFWTSEYLTELYMLLWTSDALVSNEAAVNARLFQASGTDLTIANGNTFGPTQVTFATIIYDNGSNFASNAYTTTAAGAYKFNFQGENTGSSFNLRIITYINGSYGTAYWVTVGANFNIDFTVNLNVGDVVTLYAAHNGALNVTNTREIENYVWTCISAPSSPVGLTVSMKDLMPKMKQRDFVAGVAKLFNLVIVPDSSTPNKLNVYDYQTWIASGVVKDWTYKLDTSQPITIQPTTDLQGRSINFTFQEGGAIIEQAFNNSFGYSHGTLQIADTANEFAQGEFSVEVPFVSSLFNRLNNTANLEVLQLFDLEGKAIDSAPRLMWYQGVQPTVKYYITDQSVPTISIQTTYPKFGVYTEGYTKDITLTFGQAVLDNRIPPPYNLFTEFWATYLTEIYASDAVMLTAQVVLEPSEVYGLELNTQIYLDQEYWRINKLTGYDPEKRTGTIELFRASFANGIICTETPAILNYDGTVGGLTNQSCCEYYGYRWNTGNNACYWRTSKLLSLKDDLQGMRQTAVVSLEPEQPTSTQPNEVFLFDANLPSEGISSEAAYAILDYSRSPFDLMEGQRKLFLLSAVVNETGNGTYTSSHYYSVERGASVDVVTEVRVIAADHNFKLELLVIDDRVVGIKCRSLKNANNSSLWKVRMEVQQI
jgi:hypothetical protein